jgi:hypothetical protein
MNYDNRDYEILNEYNIDELLNVIKYLDININNNIKNNKDKIIKNILKNYYIDNNINKLKKKFKNYNSINKRFILLKSAYIAGNDNKENLIELNKLKKLI